MKIRYKNIATFFIGIIFITGAALGGTIVSVSGKQLLVNCSPFMVKGTNYGPGPISSIATSGGIMWATNYDLDDTDFAQMQSMGLNAIRVYFAYSDFFNPDGSAGNPAARYNYNRIMADAYNHGIYVLADFWLPYATDYTIAANVTTVETQWEAVINLWKNNPDILIWILGNEQDISSNYQSGAFTTPTQLFALFQTLITNAKTNADANHPYCVSLGDTGDITNTTLTNSAPAVDIWGLNYYQASGAWNGFFSSYNAIQPVMFTEYGNDAYNSNTGSEDDVHQNTFYSSVWPVIGANLSALNSAKVCVGANYFEWADEWWKCSGAGTSPITHDTCGGGGNDSPDFIGNNEWYGLATEMLPGVNGPRFYRQAFTTLKTAWTNSPYNPAFVGACGASPTPTPYFTFTPTAVSDSCTTVLNNFDSGTVAVTNVLGGVWGQYFGSGGGGFNGQSPGYNGYGLSWGYFINTGSYGGLQCMLSPTANSNGAGTGLVDISGVSTISFMAADTLASSVYNFCISSAQTINGTASGGPNYSWWYCPVTLTNAWIKYSLPVIPTTFLQGNNTDTFLDNIQHASGLVWQAQTTGIADALYLDDVEFIGSGCSSPTATPTIGNTSTNTPTNTPTNTATQTTSATPTNTPTCTATLTSSATPTYSPTASDTNSPTNTPTQTATATITPTPTDSPTGTLTPPLTPTPSTTATQTPTDTPSFTPTKTATNSPTINSTSTPTSSATSTTAISSSFTPSPTFTCSPTPQYKTAAIYPNPSTDGGPINVIPPTYLGNEDVTVRIFTIAFRKIQEEVFPQQPFGPITIQLKDQEGTLLANGLYYIVVDVLGQRSILKLLIIR